MRRGDGTLALEVDRGRSLDSLIRASDGSSRWWYVTDELRTVRALLADNGSVLERHRYTDYGKPTALLGSNLPNPFHFTGRPWDPDFELHDLRARWMDPARGRFLSRDPLGTWGDELNHGNAFAYAGSNPRSRTDPFGLAQQGSSGAPEPESWDELSPEVLELIRERMASQPTSPARAAGTDEVAAEFDADGGESSGSWPGLRRLLAPVGAAVADIVGRGAIDPLAKVGSAWGTAARAGGGEEAGDSFDGVLANAEALRTEGRAQVERLTVDGMVAGAEMAATGGAGRFLARAGGRILAARGGAQSANAADALGRKLSALEKAQGGAARTRTLPDGRVRYYGAETAARTDGPTRGAALVTEHNPQTGQVRQWMESYGHDGSVVRVHPKMIDGQILDSPHFPPTGRELGR